MLRRYAALALALLAAVGLATCGVMSRISDGHLDIDQAELQARISARFPTHHCKIVIACLDLSDPVVELQEGDDRIRFTARVKVTLGTRARAGRLALTGRPRYVPSEGQLYLDDLEVTTFELAGLQDEYAELLKSRGAMAARQALQTHPVYRIDSASTNGALAKLTVRDVKVRNGRLRVTFVGAADD